MKNRLMLFSLAVALAAALIGGATMAWFTSTAAVEENVFTAGTLTIDITDPNPTVVFAVSNMAPGDTVSGKVTVENTGTLPMQYLGYLTVDLETAGLGGQGSYLADLLQATVSVAEIRDSEGNAVDPGEFSYPAPRSGTFREMEGSGFGEWAPNNMEEPFNPGWAVDYNFELTLPAAASNQYQGARLVGSIVFVANQWNIEQASTILIRLVDSQGQGIAGGIAQGHFYGSTPAWETIGTTDEKGEILTTLEGQGRYLAKITMDFGGESVTLTKLQPGNPVYTFQMLQATVRLLDDTGALIDDAAAPVYFWPYGGEETLFGELSGGTAVRELLVGPTRYFFTIKDFNGSSGNLAQRISEQPVVEFQTGRVTDAGFGCVEYWQHGGPKKTFTDGIQLLPGNFYFKNAAGVTKNLSVAAGEVLYLEQ